MTTTNREKNMAYDARQAAKVRPSTPVYNFEELEQVVRSWAAPAVELDEIYSPYCGA